MATSLDDATLVQAPLTGASPLRLGAWLVARAEQIAAEAVFGAPVTNVRHRLLAARCARLGPQIHALAQCPACDVTLEVELEARGLMEASDGAPDSVRVTLRDGSTIIASLPSVRDVLDATLAETTLLWAHICNRELDADERHDVDQALREADPLSGGVVLSCPECHEQWTARFDAFAYVVAELADDQRRVLDDVHTLARAYGWDEAAVAALPAWRRAHYRERIEQ